MKQIGDRQILATAARYAGIRNRGGSEAEALERISSDPNYSWIGEIELADAIEIGERDHQLTLRCREQCAKWLAEGGICS